MSPGGAAEALAAMSAGASRGAAADPDRRHRPVFRRPDRWAGRDSRSRPERPRRGAATAGRTGARGAARQPARTSIRPPPRGCKPEDSQRIARAWEVWRGTGLGLAAWQSQPERRRRPWRFCAILLDPPREALRAAIATRFEAMLRRGALEEVRSCWRWTSIPACRRCARMACRSCRRICAARCRWRRPGAGRNWSPASTPNGRRHGFATTLWQPRPAIFTINARFAGLSAIFGKMNATNLFTFIENGG